MLPLLFPPLPPDNEPSQLLPPTPAILLIDFCPNFQTHLHTVCVGRCQVLANLVATFEARAFFGGVSVRKSRGRLSFSDWQQMTRFKERLLQQLCIQNLTEPLLPRAQMNFMAHHMCQ